MSSTTAGARTSRGSIASPIVYRLQRWTIELLSLTLGFALLFWTVAPIYNMWNIALDSHDDIFNGTL